ncbi:MAG: SDR family NAD(P)-dependent oxidoreductase [bacterium]|nr:SDR family NAD(P)-dependent oxidoreductase [bacterium]
MSKILITGANGFIGSHLVKRFLSEGYEVLGLVRKSSDLKLLEGTDVILKYGDITDYESLNTHLAGVDVVIHNAGLASDWGSLELFRRINVEGTQNVARAAANNSVTRLVQMSTTALHGFEHTRAVEEDDAPNPQFNYSLSKLEAEQWLFDFASESDLEITAIRPGNVFGPDDHTFIEKYLVAIKSGKIAYINHGRSLTCPTYITNLVDAVFLAAFHESAPGEAFLITDGLEINWREFTEALTEKLSFKKPALSIPLKPAMHLASFVEKLFYLFNSKTPPFITRYRVLNGGTDYHFSIAKARRVLGFEPLVNLPTAVDETAEWFRVKYNLENSNY